MNILKNIILPAVVITLIFTLSGFAQQSVQGVVKGIVSDKSSGSPLESATIRIFKAQDSLLITGGSTDATGNFLITNVPEGTYDIRVSYVGYRTGVARNILINNEKGEINLGNVKLELITSTTEEIEVVSEAPIMTFEGDKRIYDAKKDLTAQSGTVLDVLKNVPSVEVDNDGNVSLRGSGNVKILINGKPSAMLSNGTQILQNIPGNMVEKVEVIHNPGAKYEAEGVSGIINIILKQEEDIGYNGNIKVNGGTQDKYNISGSANTKKGKFVLNASYSFWNYNLPGKSNIDRSNYSSINSHTVLQNFNWKYSGNSHYGSFGGDYELDKNRTLSLAGTIFYYERKLNNRNTLNFYDISGALTSTLLYNNDDRRKGFNFDGTISYTKKYEEKGRELTAFINYSGRNEDSPISYRIDDYINPVTLQERTQKYYFNFLNAQADYIHPFSETSKLEAGIKINARFINGDYNFLQYDNNSQNWIPVPGRYNDANYKDAISAFYGTFSGSYTDFSYNAGIRGEHTYLNFSILQGTQKYDRNYFDIFPSASLTQKIGPENQFQASYSRRINRPNLWFLNPFVEQFDEFTKRSGNPYLNPVYIHSVEAGYTRYFSFATLTLSGYYRNERDVINFFTTVDTNGVTFSQPRNVGKTNTYGVEFIAQTGLAKWWRINGSVSYYNTNSFGFDGMENYDKWFNALSARFSTSAQIPDIADVQLSYFYNGKQVNSQGTIDPFQMFNLAIQKSFFEKQLIVAFRINDLFNQQRFYLTANTNSFNQVVRQKTDSRVYFITLTFNFGKMDNTTSSRLLQRKQREQESEIQQSN